MALKKIITLICVLVIEIEAQFHNDANTQVGSQSATSGSNYFINEPGAQIGTDMMGSTAIFHNDQNTQVGTQYGSESDFNNQQGSQIGSMNTQVSSSGATDNTICNLIPDSGTCDTNQCGLNGESYNWCWTINGSSKWAYCNCAQDINPNQGNNGYNGNQNNANNQAVVFHNDANTQVGQQVGSPDYFNNHPETQVGNTNQGYHGNNGNNGNTAYNNNPNNGNNQAVFHNDANTQVGQQLGSSNYFNNQPETQVGYTNQGQNGNNGNTGYNGNLNNANNQAMFHNDANTQVGQQFGSSNNFNNHPETQVGNTNQGYQGNNGNVNQGYNGNNGNNAYNGNPNNANNQAMFHNDGNTQVGQQFGSPNNFNNHPNAQIGNTPRTRYARSPQSALCPVCKAGFLEGFNNPLLTGVNEEGATFNMNAQIDSQTVGKGGTFFNDFSQIGLQKDIGLGGLGFINKGSQVQTQFGRGKRAAQFKNFGSGVGKQIGLDGSSFYNENSQIGQAHASAGASVTGVGSQYQHQQGYGSDVQLLTLLGRGKRAAQFKNFGSGVGTQIGLDGSSFLNQDSQIGQAHASAGASVTGVGSQYQHQQGYGSDVQLLTLLGRRKRQAQFHNIGSAVGTQVGFDGSSFLNQNSQIGQAHASAGASVISSGSQIQFQTGYANNAQLLAALGRKKREAQFINIGSGVGKQVGLAGSSFSNHNSQIASQLAAKGSIFGNQASQIQSQQGFGSNADLLSGLNIPAVGSGHIFNKQSQIGTQFGGRK